MTLRGESPTRTPRLAVGDAVTVATRPERLEVVAGRVDRRSAGPGVTQVPGRIQQGTYLGDQTEYRVETEEAGELIVRHQNAAGAGGARVSGRAIR